MDFSPEELAAEEWLPVVGFRFYEVSSLGRVRSWKLRRGRGSLAPSPTVVYSGLRVGYPSVTLRQDGKQHRLHVHNLVLAAFVGPRPEGHVARHFPDDTKTNVRLSNLSWSTHSQNALDKRVHGTAAVGLRNGTYTRPERKPMGTRNGVHSKPERMARGERCGAAKLTASDVLQIRAHRGWLSLNSLAETFGVSFSMISKIQHKKWWAWL